MKKIIVFPGSSSNIFFLNEIEFIKKKFDSIVVFSFTKTSMELSKQLGVKIYDIIYVYKYIFSFTFIKWLFSNETKLEIKKILKSRRSLGKMSYLIYYGLYYIASIKQMDYEIKNGLNKEIVLYSLWLTKGAYVISKWIDHPNVRNGISRAHGYDLYETRNKYQYLPFRDYIGNKLSEICFISKNGLDYFTDTYQNTKSKKSIYRLGTLKTDLFKKYQSKNYVTLVSCSSIINVKRLDLIIDVLSEVTVPIKWFHIGSGSDEIKIKIYAASKLILDNYKFLGYVSHDKILDNLINLDADYIINLSDSEGIPVSIMEAMSVGIPAIARDVGGISEIVGSDNGLLLSKDENTIMYAKLITIELTNRLNQLDVYISKSSNAYDVWKKLYNAQNNLNLFFSEVYNA